MTNLVSVAKIQLNTLTEFQKELHLNTNGDEEEIVESKFSYKFVKTSWTSNLPAKLEFSKDGEKISFKADMKFDFLMYTYIRQLLKAYKIDKKYQGIVEICWPHNIGHNIYPTSTLTFDDIPVQSHSNFWMDVNSQLLLLYPEKRPLYDMMIGNIKFLEEWTNFLPGFPLSIPQPWYYCKHIALSVPLFLCSLATMEHKYKIRNEITSLLRMRIRKDKDSKWKEIKCNWKYIDGINKNEKLPNPEMWGRYVRITRKERE